MFRSIRRGVITICLVAAFVAGILLGSGRMPDMQAVASWHQSVREAVDVDSTVAYIQSVCPQLQKHVQQGLTGLFSVFLEKILE